MLRTPNLIDLLCTLGQPLWSIYLQQRLAVLVLLRQVMVPNRCPFSRIIKFKYFITIIITLKTSQEAITCYSYYRNTKWGTGLVQMVKYRQKHIRMKEWSSCWHISTVRSRMICTLVMIRKKYRMSNFIRRHSKWNMNWLMIMTRTHWLITSYSRTGGRTSICCWKLMTGDKSRLKFELAFE